MSEVPETLTFEQARDMVADDLKAVAEEIGKSEARVRAGDVSELPRLLDKMSDAWPQMLYLRFEDRMARYEASKSDPSSAGQPVSGATE